ncbi:MAG: EI24 domain-containing protein [Chloroflexales bacterium]|nr:EI24 domain-containing protein [Chloroflexales bacterium]
MSYPFRALALLTRTPRLWRYVVVPLLVNVLVGLLLYAGLFFAGLQAINRVAVGEGALAATVRVLLQVLLIVGLLLLIGFVLVRFGVVLGAPWYGQLSAELEQRSTGIAPPEGAAGVGGALGDIGRALSFEAKKLLLLVAIGLPLLLLNLVPVAGNILATAGSIILGATIACLDFFDGPLERRRLAFRAKLGAIRRALPASAGFGLVCLGLVSIPLVNLVAIPICVAAGTLFVCDYLLTTGKTAR